LKKKLIAWRGKVAAKKKDGVNKRPKMSRIELNKDSELQTQLPAIPFPVWVKVMNNLSLSEGASLASTSKGLSQRWREYQKTQEGCRHFLIERNIFPEDLFVAAENQGIRVNYIYLDLLHRTSFNEAMKLADLSDDNLAPLAAICGDMRWLYEHVEKEKFIDIVEYLGFTQDQSVIADLLNNGYISTSGLEDRFYKLSYFAAFGANESILEAFGYSIDNCLQWLIRAGKLELALGQYGERLEALKGTPEISQLSLDAAENGHFHVCDHLEKYYGASNAAKDKFFDACQIHYAAFHDDKDRVIRLLNDVHHCMIEDEKGLTPLHYAAQGGAIRTLLYLMEEYPEYQKQTGCDYTNPVTTLIIYGHTSTVELLQKRYRVNLRVHDESGSTLLFRAAQGGHWSSFVYLRDDNQIPCTVNKNGDLPVFLAFLNGAARFVAKYVKEYGDECLTRTNNYGDGAAINALRCKNLPMVAYFIETYDMNLNTLNKWERTPLHQLAHISKMQNETGWQHISECAQKFENRLQADWQTQPDVNGKTFLDVVVENSQQDKFPQFFGANNTLK
jgi:ankyrin repeat protein